jgi:DNA-binding IclR family transcriptional regulator
VVERAVQLLKLLAAAGKPGMALTRLSTATGLANSTVHRLLGQLCAQGMVVQRDANKRYALGPLVFELGLAASSSYDPRERCAPFLRRLAEEVRDTVYLTVRSGCDAVCVDRHEGPSPVRVLTLDVGSRRPLGMGAGGLAILAYVRDTEREELIQQLCKRRLARREQFEEELRAAVLACRRNGYAFIRNRVNAGVSAVGVPLLDSLDQPIAAVSVAAIDARMRPARITALAALLQQRVRVIRQSMLGPQR